MQNEIMIFYTNKIDSYNFYKTLNGILFYISISIIFEVEKNSLSSKQF